MKRIDTELLCPFLTNQLVKDDLAIVEILDRFVRLDRVLD